MARSQRRPRQPRPVEGHVGDRDLPHCGAWRSRRALQRLRPHVEIAYNSRPGTVIARSAKARRRDNGWKPSETICCRSPPTITFVFTLPAPIAPSRSRIRPSSTTCCSGPPPRRCRHCGQPKTLRGSRWLHRRAAHLGLGSDLPPARAHIDCARRRPIVGRFRAGSPASPASSCPSGRCRACSGALFLEGLAALHQAGRLAFFGDLVPLADRRALTAALAPFATDR